MCDRLDLEVRIYLTGRPGGQLEWQVIAVDDGGQTSFEDGGISPWKPGVGVLPSLLGRASSLALRRAASRVRQF